MEEMLCGLCLRFDTQASLGHQLPPVPFFSTPSPVISTASAVNSSSTSSATQGAATNLYMMSLDSTHSQNLQEVAQARARVSSQSLHLSLATTKDL